MDIPQSELEVREHIAQIRKSKGLDGPEGNTLDLEAALILLSEQLYQKSTHFLLELIQNADDNSYEDSQPTLNITYEKRALRIDCNEIGFGRKNVEAICKIGRSTKSGLGNATRYIGEKGIGFKSVFKVSQIVWISSGYYSFKFDKNEKLGMIAPNWANFPGRRLAGYTSILLQLSADYDPRQLIAEIKSLDPRLLVFLRQLRRINITITDKSGKTWKSTLGRHDNSDKADGLEIVRLLHNKSSSTLRIIRYPVAGLPPDLKRPGCTVSEILLAFPTMESGEPSVESQNVYAFLPVRDYGLKFLLQSDFLLIASREDIDSSSAWNVGLLNAIPQAILHAIEQFNKRDDLRYTWIRYFPKRPPLLDFFQHLESMILAELSREPIVESLNGALKKPSTLRYVPAGLRDENGNSFFYPDRAKATYVSTKYSLKDAVELSRIGVKELSPEEFLADLRAFIHEKSQDFWEKSSSWHSRLSQVLARLLNDKPKLKPLLSALEIVPLRDNRWVSPSQGNICFPSNSLIIPKGLGIHEIDPTAAKIESRRIFLVLLGALTLSKDLVCNVIIKRHEHQDFKPEKRTLEELVSHVAFLYKANWKNNSGNDLWVLTEGDSPRRGSELYLDSTDPHSATVLFKGHRKRFLFLHKNYAQAFPAWDQDWRAWLTNELGIAQFPRLVARFSLQSQTELTLSKDFQFIFENCSSQRVLLLFRDHWLHYSAWIHPDKRLATKISNRMLQTSISSMRVKCRGGAVAQLRHTVLPQSDLSHGKIASMHLLDVPEPRDHRWTYLRHFGVITEPGAAPFIQCLRRLRESSASLEKVSEVYKQIQGQARRERESIRKAFNTEKLVYVPVSDTKSSEHWTTLGVCAWDGPKFLRKTPCLKDFHPDHEKFFCDTLGLSNANLKTLIDEAQHIQAFDSLEYIAQVFIAINTQLEMNGDSTKAGPTGNSMSQTLTKSRIFPVGTKKSSASIDDLKTALESDQWFIADRWHLRRSFEGLVPLLSLDVESVDKIGVLIQKTGLQHRLLSKVASGVPRTNGPIEAHLQYTKILQSKAKFIARLLPTQLLNRVTILDQLRHIEVYKVETLTIEWKLKSIKPSAQIVGRTESGRVKMTPIGPVLKIFLRNDVDPTRPPLELQEEMAKFCGITDRTNGIILNWILTENNLKEIEDNLQRRGIQSVPGFDDPGISQDELKRLLDSEARRQYCGRGARFASADPDSLDAVRSFINRFNLANSFKSTINRPWQEVEVGMMLSHVCRIDNIDPISLLPQNRTSLSRKPWQSSGYLDEPATVVFSETSALDYTNHRSRDAQVLPAIVRVSRNGSVSIDVSTAIQNTTNEEILFAGELHISKLLEQNLGRSYVPTTHWTSRLRGRAGLTPYQSDDMTRSTFTIDDEMGTLTSWLIQKGCEAPTSWNKYPTYHVEVNTSENKFLSSFCLDPYQVQKARKCNLEIKRSRNPREVFVLIRICNVRTNPEIAILVDPWQLHIDGLLSLTSESQYKATFNGLPPAIYIQENGEVSASRKCNGDTGLSGTSPENLDYSHSDVPRIDVEYFYNEVHFGEIRLLKLFPGTGDEPLEGEVFHTPLGSAGPYSAISYVWGVSLKPYNLSTAKGRLRLTASLHSALKQVRDGDKAILIWADAICINQTDGYEKAIQIRLMQDIFRQATKVIAWIGDENDGSDIVMRTLLQIRTLVVKPNAWPKGLPRVSWTRTGNIPALTDNIWGDIAKFFHRDWFRRVWVVQELVLASRVRVICGTWDLSWEDIFSALETCLKHISVHPRPSLPLRQFLVHSNPAHALGTTRRMLKNAKLSRDFCLLSLLEQFAHTSVTQERDKLFALLGIALDATDDVFNPDYSSSLETVVRRYADEFVRRGNAIELIYKAGASKSYDFCSWIPKWTGRDHRRTISTWCGADGVFCASGATTPQTQSLPNDWSKLEVLGVQFDSITRLCPTTTNEQDIISVVNTIHAMIDKACINGYLTGERPEDLKLKVPIGNAMAPCSDNIAPPDVDVILVQEENKPFNWAEEFSPIGSVQEMVNFLHKPHDNRQRSWKYWTTAATFAQRLSNGRFCVTKRGYVGIVPYEANIGDEICVFHGGAVPFILRRDSLRGSQFRLIGESYIHGIMYGEALSFDGISETKLILV
ncbi:hypothetical protein DL98DRAFT_661395 [Cadophora sp. DSE1049]|nr:hypothetical protein DL98DRAFT_661395 [Cadophora sp. DSE1049]